MVDVTEALAGLTVDLEMLDGDVITDAVVIARVQRVDAPAAVILATSQGTDVVVRLGLIASAQQIEAGTPWDQRE